MYSTNTTLCTTSTPVTNVLGYSSTVIFTVLLIPQVYKTTVDRSSKDLSLLFLLLGELGCSLMIPYAAILDLKPILISNIIMFTFNSYLTGFKLLEVYGFFG